jgi:hypothetical protein
VDSLTQLLAHFREEASRAGDLSDPKAQNNAARQVQAFYKQLRATDEGKRGIIGLMSDPSPHVRLCAAARSLQWEPQLARGVLEALQRDKIFPYSFDAEMTLKEFDKGTLNFDY